MFYRLGMDSSSSGGSIPSLGFRYYGERRQVLRELANLHQEYALRCEQVLINWWYMYAFIYAY